MIRFLQSLVFGCALALASSSVQAQTGEAGEPGLNEATFKGLEWRGIGPALMSGRIADIAIDQTDRSTWYIAVGSGGLWKTENRHPLTVANTKMIKLYGSSPKHNIMSLA